MTTVDAVEDRRLARAGLVALGALLAVLAVGIAIGGSGLRGDELTIAMVPVTALLAWRLVGRRPLRELFATRGSLRWAALVLAASVPAAVTGAMVLAGATETEDAGGAWTGMFAAVVIGGLVAALPEEVTFRGVLLRGLGSTWGPRSAAAVTSVLFAAFHVPRLLSQGQGLQPVHLLPLSISGVIFAVLAIAAGSIWPAQTAMPTIAAERSQSPLARNGSSACLDARPGLKRSR